MQNYSYDYRSVKIAYESEDFEGGYWLTVVNMDLPSYEGGPKVFPIGMTRAGTKEEAGKEFDSYRKKWRGRPASTDELNLVRFDRPVSIPKSGWQGTLVEFLRKFRGKKHSGIGSALR